MVSEGPAAAAAGKGIAETGAVGIVEAADTLTACTWVIG